VLLSVAEAGSFAGAARRLQRATSAISYAVDTLEAQLGITLFERGTTRRAKLSHAGEAVVAEAKSLVLTEQPAADRRDFGVVSVNVWRLGDLASKHALLLAGIGWGGMPLKRNVSIHDILLGVKICRSWTHADQHD
jgi:regulatory helix-turn-helix LysR family protein